MKLITLVFWTSFLCCAIAGKLATALLLFLSASIMQFSLHYMADDRAYIRYFLSLAGASSINILLLEMDTILLLPPLLAISNLLTALLMIHNFKWQAARNAGVLTFKIWGIGLFCLAAGVILFIYDINNPTLTFLPLFLIFLATCNLSGIWPFHRWLLNSLNAPTPVCAFLHGTITSTGGFLLVRFSPLFSKEPLLLFLLLLSGFLSLFLGFVWKSVQSDAKRRLACSTMSQMGLFAIFLGLGFFSFAVAYLFWHGISQTFLFLRCMTPFRRPNQNFLCPKHFYVRMLNASQPDPTCSTLSKYGY